MRYIKAEKARKEKYARVGEEKTVLVSPEIREAWCSQHSNISVIETKAFWQYYGKNWTIADVEEEVFEAELQMIMEQIFLPKKESLMRILT